MLLLGALLLAGCSPAADGGQGAASSPVSETPVTSSPSPTVTPSSSPVAVEPFEPGPSDELVSLAVAAADGVGGDLYDWAGWLGCVPTRSSDPFLGCRVRLADGLVDAVLVDWFASAADDDGQVDMSAALLMSQVGRSSVLGGLCPDGAGRDATVTVAMLAPGYDMVFFDQSMSPEGRLDAADEVAAAMSRKLRAAAVADPDQIRDVLVIRCADVDS